MKAKASVCLGAKWWNRAPLTTALSGGGDVIFEDDEAKAVSAAKRLSGRLVVWASRESPSLKQACRAAGVPLLRVEDGFIRSVGLGVHFVPSSSFVLDDRGIYFDPAEESRLEWLIANSDFDAALLERSRKLIDAIAALRITKYNLAANDAAPPAITGRACIFVPGQVEDDASILHGAGDIRTNLDLLKRARRASPGAYVIYKPHPDVQRGARKGKIPDSEALKYADEIDLAPSNLALMDWASEVHTMTSLTGFEALLRGKHIVVYGSPFYAGWGLTEDHAPFPPGRRTRRVTIEALAAATLILYPIYVDPVSNQVCGPETIVERFGRQARDADRWMPLWLRTASRLRRGPLGTLLQRLIGRG